MFGLFSKGPDFEALGLDLIRGAAEYQTPTVDGIYRFLEATGQLRLDGDVQEKKLINVAAAAVSGELFVVDLGGDPKKAEGLLNAFYGCVQELLDMNRPDAARRVTLSRRVVTDGIHQAMRAFRDRGSAGERGVEIFAYEIARVVIALYASLVGYNYEITQPNARADFDALAEAASGIARSDRWLHNSLSAKFRKALRP